MKLLASVCLAISLTGCAAPFEREVTLVRTYTITSGCAWRNCAYEFRLSDGVRCVGWNHGGLTCEWEEK